MGSNVIISLPVFAALVCAISAYASTQVSQRGLGFQTPVSSGYRAPQAPRQSFVANTWSAWGQYGACSAQCGWGTEERYRTCIQSTQYGASQRNAVGGCQGSDFSHRRCFAGCCAGSGNWGQWSRWSVVQGSQQTRTRRCIAESASCGANTCFGSAVERRFAAAPVQAVFRAPAQRSFRQVNNGFTTLAQPSFQQVNNGFSVQPAFRQVSNNRFQNPQTFRARVQAPRRQTVSSFRSLTGNYGRPDASASAY